MTKVKTAVIILMCMLAFPSMNSSAASCGETVRQNTEDALKAVDYGSSDQVAALLAPSRYFSYEITNKKLEISRRDGRKITEISDAEAKRELDRENLQVTSLEESFKEAQEQIGPMIQRILDHTSGAQEKGAAAYTGKILQNKEKLLLGIAYIKRLYDFDMGEKNICDVLLYEPGTYGVQTDVVDWLIKIGGAGGDALKISNNANVFGYGKLFWDVTGYGAVNLGAFLEMNRQKWIPDMSMDEWFLGESRAWIVEESSSWNRSADTGLYDRLYQDAALRPHILPLLTVSDDSIYVIANAASITYGIVDCYVDRELKNADPVLYGKKREQFRKDLEHMARQQREFIDVWYRLAKPGFRGQLSANRIIKDSLRIYTEHTVSVQTEWSAKFGADAAKGVREFFSPLDLYDNFMFADGMADGNGVRYYMSKALSERGLATYAHELTHLLVSQLMLNGYGARDGMQAEVYARGMFEPYELKDPPAFNLNLIYDRLGDDGRLENAVPGRFQSETDLKDYMNGILDVIYTLDYAEADVICSKTPEEKKKWFHKLEQTEDTKTRYNQGEEGSVHFLDSVRELTQDEAEELNTIEDLIRNGIIVSRYEVNGTKTIGTMASNGYYVVPLFSANYAGVENNRGVSGDAMIRRQAFELLAEYGYYDGMVPYISNQYKEEAKAEQVLLSDTFILKKISGGEYSAMADFKAAMFQRRIEKAGQLKPVSVFWNGQTVTIRDFQTLRQLMKEAVESDLIHVKMTADGFCNIRAQDTQVERLKAEIFRAYLVQTGDFKESIYGSAQEPEEPPVVTPPEPEEPPVVTPPEPEEPPVVTPPDPEEPPVVTPPEPEEPPVVTPPEPEEPPVVTPPEPEEPPVVTPPEPEEPPVVTPPDLEETPAVTPSKPSVAGGQKEQGSGAGKDQVLNADLLFAWASSVKTSSQTLRWKAVSQADGYAIYGAKSNEGYKLLQTTGKNVRKWKHTKLKKGTQYKYRIEAYKITDGKRVVTAVSLPFYSITKGGKYGNPVKLKVKKASVSVKPGKKVKLKITMTGRKLDKNRKKIRYIPADPSVVKVSNKGVIIGIKSGTSDLYCIAGNGLFKKVRIKVG